MKTEILILISILLIGTNNLIAQNEEMTVLLGGLENEGGYIFTFSDSIKHNINLEIDGSPINGNLATNYSGPLGGFTFEYDGGFSDSTQVYVVFSGDIDFSYTIEIPYETSITSHNDGDTFNEGIDLIITFESTNYTYFSIWYTIEYDEDWEEYQIITIEPQITIPAEQLSGAYSLYFTVNAINGPIPGEELAIVEGNVLSLLTGNDGESIMLYNSSSYSKYNQDIRHNHNYQGMNKWWDKIVKGSMISMASNTNRDISETDVFVYGILANKNWDGYYEKEAWFLLMSQSLPDDASVILNGDSLEGEIGAPGIWVFYYYEEGQFNIGETHTVEITAHATTTTTEIIVPDSTSILNWSNGDTYHGSEDFVIEWEPSSFVDFYSIGLESWGDLPDVDTTIFTTDTSVTIPIEHFPSGNYELEVMVHPFTGVSPEFESGGNIDGSYGFIWGQGGWELVEIHCEIPASVEENYTIIPTDFQLYQNFPNPFNPVTTISYQLPKSEFINISIYNLEGQLIETLINQQIQPGFHSVEWKAKDLGSGVYFYKVTSEKYSKTGKCLLLK